jgi:predicted NBD/HSP70 family sugar kinase
MSSVADAGTAPLSTGIMRIFKDGLPRTRADVIAESGHARSTIGPQLDALTAHGLLIESGVTKSTGGRRPTAFMLNPDSYLILAIDLGPNHLRLALSNLRFKILGERTEVSEMAGDPEIVFDRIEAIARELLREHNPEKIPLAGIGVGLPTPVNYPSGRPMLPPLMPGWHDYDVEGRLQRLASVPVIVDRDNNLRAVGEFIGRSPNESVLYVHVSTYIGSGLIVNGRLARGAGGSAGYFGHLSGDWSQDQLCMCGKYGCLEAVASSHAILRDVGPELGVSTAAELTRLAAAGNPTASRAIRTAGRNIGTAIANFVSVLNPSHVVIGGSLMRGNLELLSGVRETVFSKAFPLPAQLLQVDASIHGYHSAVLGANVLVKEAFFERDLSAAPDGRWKESSSAEDHPR